MQSLTKKKTLHIVTSICISSIASLIELANTNSQSYCISKSLFSFRLILLKNIRVKNPQKCS